MPSKMRKWNITISSRQDYTQLGDPDEFVEGLNPMKQGHLKALESLVNEDFDNSNENSHSSCLKNEDVELNQSQNNLSFEDNHIPRPVIPIGPRFQAEVPTWEDRTNIQHNDDSLKLMGIQLWPMPNISENKTNDVGGGRCDSCSCEFPGSIDCVKLRIREARELLKLEIGATFSRNVHSFFIGYVVKQRERVKSNDKVTYSIERCARKLVVAY
ncbi:hypothetical protein JHK86_018595 [Glycine max]|nr:hypothetical protein JHK86_018595 [Glycine max]